MCFSEGELLVSDLTVEIAAANSLLIQWIAPFSLAITSLSTSTEVTYCVDVYNSTDQTLETSICGLNETQYRYEAMSDPSPCDGVDIYVIPVNIVGNGSRSHIAGTFYNSMLLYPYRTSRDIARNNALICDVISRKKSRITRY